MRLRNVKNKKEILSSCSILIINPEDYIGKWNTVFGNSNDIEIELGMGKGNFIIQKAIHNKNINYIGIEKYDSVLAKAIEKIPDDLSNLRIIRMDVLNIDKVFCKEVSKVYLNFSDPWPKKRHSFRRLTSPIFLDKYEGIFKDKKVICQKTDNVGLFEYSIVSLNSKGYVIKEISLDLHSSEIENLEITEYEDKFCKKGNKINYLLAEK